MDSLTKFLKKIPRLVKILQDKAFFSKAFPALGRPSLFSQDFFRLPGLCTNPDVYHF